jgi:hypothetical protein
LRCLEVDVQGRIRSAEKNELFTQPFLKFLAILFGLINHWLVRFVTILQANSNWVLDAFVDERPKVHRLERVDVILSSSARLISDD